MSGHAGKPALAHTEAGKGRSRDGLVDGFSEWTTGALGEVCFLLTSTYHGRFLRLSWMLKGPRIRRAPTSGKPLLARDAVRKPMEGA